MIYRRVIVIDVDGVLRPTRAQGEESGIDPDCCACLARIVRSGCEIVLSSSWRYSGFRRRSIFGQCVFDACRSFLRLGDAIAIVGNIVGATRLDKSPREPRHLAILDWVAEHKPEQWVAIDDLDDIRKLPDGHWVQTDGAVGLTDADADMVIELLGGEP